jgi:squalene-hopene/tetraprenyl-beta-curcumene cyclase
VSVVSKLQSWKRAATRGLGVLVVCLAAGVHANAQAARSWNASAAAAYLDQRAAWWTAWPAASRDHGTFCISCHTALPYSLSRPALHAALGEDAAPSLVEQKILDNVTKRVRLWNEASPFYSENSGVNKSRESRGTESVLNALILANHDARGGRLGEDTRAAFANLWALQRTTGDAQGSWWWLQFNNEPWEGHDSGYFGAALAALAVGTAPENYASAPEIQANLKLLREYLNREYTNQSVVNQVVVLWASVWWTGLLSSERQRALIDELFGKQRADGGWGLETLAWTWKDLNLRSMVKMIRSDGTPLEARSDAYATALITFVLEQAGLPSENVQVRRGLEWLERSQDGTEGRWRSYSINGHHDPSSKTALFMSDAATAYAVLALTAAEKH